MYIRPYKDRWRFAEAYSDPLTGRKREVSVILDKNTTASRKEASTLLQEKIRAKTASASPENMRLHEIVDKFIKYQYQMRKESTAKQDEIVLRGVCSLIGSDVLVSKITAPISRERLDRTGKDATWKNIKISISRCCGDGLTDKDMSLIHLFLTDWRDILKSPQDRK
jgi:hypothetical protein